MCFLPLEDIEANHFQTVHSLPHFRDFQNEYNVVLAKNRKELVTKVKILFKQIEDQSFPKKMKKISEKYVTNFKDSYSKRILELIDNL